MKCFKFAEKRRSFCFKLSWKLSEHGFQKSDKRFYDVNTAVHQLGKLFDLKINHRISRLLSFEVLNLFSKIQSNDTKKISKKIGTRRVLTKL